MSAAAEDVDIEPGWPPGVTPPPRGDELPCDDGEPLETFRHRAQMNLLIEGLEVHWAEREDFFAGGNMFLYYSATQAKKNDFRGPDVFVVLDTDRRERKAWVVWEEGGRVPNVIIEITSESTAHIDRGPKMRLYERALHIPEYFLYDPFSHELEGYLNGASGYQPIARTTAGRLQSPSTGLELGLWEGRFGTIDTTWLRWFTPAGVVLATNAEVAEDAQRHAEEAQRHAEEAQRHADDETRRADDETRRADEQAQRADDYAARLAEYERRFGRLGVAEDDSVDR